MIIDCNAPIFRGLTNPYTGEPIKVKMLVNPNTEPMFFAPETYSTTNLVDTAAKAIELWDRIDGVSGLKNKTSVMTCAYTGEKLVLDQVFEKWSFRGGFDPGQFTTRDKFLYFVTMRDGKPSGQFPEPTKLTPVTIIDREPHIYETEDPIEQTTEAENIVAAITDKLGEASGLEKKTVVRGANLKKTKGKK